MTTMKWLFFLSLMSLASLVAGPVQAGTIYDRPLLFNPSDDARFYIYDPVTKTDRNILWGQIKGVGGGSGPITPVINWRDEWQPGPVSYSAASNDIVYRNGATYRCVQDNTGIDPATDAVHAYWYPVAEKGDAGAAGSVAVGTVATVSPGTPASVTNGGTPSAAVLNFSIPQGAQGVAGAKGDAATVAVGPVTTVPPGTPASVTNSGTPGAAVLNFSIPQGAQGVPGSPGLKGDKGDTGAAGAGLIPGGSIGQVLAKKSLLDYDNQWVTLGGAASLNVGTGVNTVAAGNDSRFTDARTPLGHKASHAAGAADEITPAAIGAATAAQGAKADTALQPGAVGSEIAAASSATPADADSFGYVSGVLKKLTWGSLKTTVKNWFGIADSVTEYGAKCDGSTDDSAAINTAIATLSAAGSGALKLPKNATCAVASPVVPRNNVSFNLNNSRIKWTGAAGGAMVENSTAAAGTTFFEMFNGYLDPGTNASVGFKLHSVKQSSIHDITLASTNPAIFEFMQLIPDSTVGDAAVGERNVVDNVFGPFLSENGVVVKRVLTLTGSNPPWQVTTGNKFVGPWVFYAKEKGIVFKQYCDSNEFNGLFRITLANDTVPGTCVVFNDSATPSVAADVWGEHFTHLSCETWYPSLAGQKAVEINHAGGITIDYLGNDRVTQGTWPVGMVTDNYSQGHKITYVEGAPNYKVKEYLKGDLTLQGTGNGLVLPDGSKLASAPDSVSCGTGKHISAYDSATGSYTCTDDATTGGSTDTNAVHVNGTGEIAAVTQKATPVSGDWLLIEDSTAGNAKKRVSVGSLPSSVPLSDSTSTTSSTTAASSTAVKAAYDLAASKQSPATTLAGYGITDGVVAAGKATGQTINGGTGFEENLYINSTSNSSKNSIVLDGGRGWFEGKYGRLLLTTNTGINPTTAGYPASRLHIVAENTIGADDAGTRQEMYTSASAFPSTAYYRARGSFASPSKVLSGDRLGGVAARGYQGIAGSGGGFPSGGTATIFFDAAEDFNGTSNLGTFIKFEATPIGSGTRSEKLRLYGDGGLQLGGSYGTSPGPGSFALSGDAVESPGADVTDANVTVTEAYAKLTVTSVTQRTVTLPASFAVKGVVSKTVEVCGASGVTPNIAWSAGAGTVTFGDDGPPAFTPGKCQLVQLVTRNTAATSAAQWKGFKAGGTF